MIVNVSDDEEDVKPPKLSPQKRTSGSDTMPPAKKAPDANGNVRIPNRNLTEQEQKSGTTLGNIDQEVKDLLNSTAMRLKPDMTAQLASKATSKSKQSEFTAKLMGLQLPEAQLNRGWTEHPVIQLGREEVNNRFSEMPFNNESEKRMGIPQPTQALKSLAPTAAETLLGADMHRLPHALRQDLPQGAKIESLENKSKLPKQVEDEIPGLLWAMVRIF